MVFYIHLRYLRWASIWITSGIQSVNDDRRAEFWPTRGWSPRLPNFHAGLVAMLFLEPNRHHRKSQASSISKKMIFQIPFLGFHLHFWGYESGVSEWGFPIVSHHLPRNPQWIARRAMLFSDGQLRGGMARCFLEVNQGCTTDDRRNMSSGCDPPLLVDELGGYFRPSSHWGLFDNPRTGNPELTQPV